MDGSIADSTVLRMRTQLQRMHHSSPTNQADGFLEELLKLPANPLPDPQAEVAPTVDSDADEPLTALSDPPATQAERTEDEPPNDEEPARDEGFAAPCLPVCYAPTPLPVPDPEPVAVTVNTEPESQAAIAPAIIHPSDVAGSAEQNEPGPAISQPVVEVNAVADQATSEEVEPIVPTAVGAKEVARPMRDMRRPRDARDKTGSVADGLPTKQAPVDPDTTENVPSKTASKEAPQVKEEVVQATEPTVVNESHQPLESKRDRAHDRDAQKENDKWYEKEANGEEQGQTSSLAERVQEILAEQDKQTEQSTIEATVAQNVADVSSSLTEVPLVDPAQQSSVDMSALASDVLVAAQASLSQSADSQRVTEASSSSGVDTAGRGRSTIPSGITSSNAVASSRTVSAAASSASAATSSNTSSDNSTEITQQERVRLVQRVVRSFSRLGPEGGQVTLKLHPPQLGVLNVSIKIEGAAMTARLQTESAAARDTIMESLPVLRDRLQEQGIEIEKFQVEVGQQEDLASGNGQSNSFTGNGAESQQGNASPSTEYDYRRAVRNQAGQRNLVAPTIVEPKLQTWSLTDRSLDVRA